MKGIARPVNPIITCCTAFATHTLVAVGNCGTKTLLLDLRAASTCSWIASEARPVLRRLSESACCDAALLRSFEITAEILNALNSG